ncbi:MAG: HAMP domain-containing histidine kinase, partial [Thermoleophilia bacterium]|nr:HAMP domain-containing histidine kinase [Thermoleophilia bacterium]
MRIGRPRALRSRLLLAVVAGVGVALVLLVVVFNVILAATLANDADEIARARAEAELATLTVIGDVVVVDADRTLASTDTPTWVFSGGRTLEAPPPDPRIDAAARALDGGPERSVDVDEIHLHARPITSDGVRVGTVVSGISLAPYNRTRAIALIASSLLALIVLSAVAVASAAMLRAALRPVARMTADAAAWSESDLDSRFAAGPPHDEITRLAATLDGLLDRLAAGMRRERRLTAEVSHELRTPLAQITAEVDLAMRRDRAPEDYRQALERIREGADRIERTVETLMATARQESLLPRGAGDAADAAARVVAACEPLGAQHGVRLEMAAPEGPSRAGVEEQVIERILQPIVENACRFATARVRVAVGTDERGVSLEVADDGPGVADEDREAIFEPGTRREPAGG